MSPPETRSESAGGRLPAPLRAVLSALLLAVAGLGGGSLVVEAVFLAGLELSLLVETVLRVLLLQGVAFGGLSALYLQYRGLPADYVGVSVPDLEGWIHAGAGYVLALVGAFSMIFVVVFLLGLTPAQNRAAELGQQDSRVFLALLVLAVLVIGPGEELLFRGVVQSRLRETFSAPLGIGLATVIFAVAHAPALAGPTSGVALTITLLFVPALVFAVVYERTDNVVVPAVTHGAYNATLFGLAYLSVAMG
ncbi:CPBP family intramembrane glutamic endopeptidase [Natronomonas marina]|jgi:membrane protease YdiL (CAAX protease family)|uniref:CPBP family intramembrane glutamic endopeptidase n=1 Tax=Natronomonas marina TaxID=2961939 RepID=UPI0020C9B06C|nr:type II CAAX endopeptidase family protein [Natronomonas marina]